jgi:hypothetical protein
VHSSIETAKRKTSVFVPSQWHTVIALARKRNPYVVIPIKFTDIKDFTSYTNKVCLNRKMSCTREKVNWLRIRWIQVRKGERKSIFVDYTFEPSMFLELKIQHIRKVEGKAMDLQTFYRAKLPITAAKKKDLLSLCASGIIPSDVHDFCRNLTASASAKDNVPPSDVEEVA